jgi:hypothetical protein
LYQWRTSATDGFRSGAIHRRKAAASALTPACLSATASKSPGGLPQPNTCLQSMAKLSSTVHAWHRSLPESTRVQRRSGVLMPTVGVTVTLCSAGDCTMDWQGFRPVA